MNVCLWMFSLTQVLSEKIEKLQKIALYIILGKNADTSYSANLAKLNCETLSDRRSKIAENFAKKTLKHPAHRKMFKIDLNAKTRKGKRIIIPTTKTARYAKSSIPSLGNLINEKLTRYI